MGLFDDVVTTAECPFCGTLTTNCQTKDLDSAMFEYVSLPKDWYEEYDNDPLKIGGTRKFQQEMPAGKRFPFDKQPELWANNAEYMEARAMLEEPYNTQLKFINVTCRCSNCDRVFYGKVEVQNGMLFGEVYDIAHDQ